MATNMTTCCKGAPTNATTRSPNTSPLSPDIFTRVSNDPLNKAAEHADNIVAARIAPPR